MPRALAWSESFSVGHAGLDAEHRSLIEAVNAISAADKANCAPKKMQSMLDDLKAAVEKHFDHENSLLRVIVSDAATGHRSPKFLRTMSEAAISEHIDDHQEAFAYLDTVIRAKYSRTRSEDQPLSDDLINWFLEHAIKHDAHLKAIFQAIQSECPHLLDGVA
jgi:hemerythrin